MSRLTIHVQSKRLVSLDVDWERIEFYGEFHIDSLQVGSRGDTTLNLIYPRAEDILVYQENWTIWVLDEEAKADPEWTRLYSSTPQEEEEND
ncbi:MAG: hypothetical protein HYY29_03525 [Chloroflexi bacterium]|nr:hypothetical protein [Chloroflexota bacterium]